MFVGKAEARDSDAIEDFVRGTECASLYHLYGWRSVIRDSFGHECPYLLCKEEGGAIRGVLPLTHLRSAIFGNFLVSLPYFNYGGVCAPDSEVRRLLVAEAVRVAGRLGAGHIEFRQQAPLENGFPAKIDKVSMRLDLPADGADLWKSFPAKLRSQIRKPRKEGLTARIARHEQLDDFYNVFSVNMRDLGTPVYPKRFFRNILEAFPDDSWICTVFDGGMPLASGFLLGFRETVEIPWASSLRAYNRLGSNMLLYWSCLEFGCERGFRVFDFGRSTAGESTYRFKEQWGTTPFPMYWHYWLARGGVPPEINPRNPKYRLAIGLWKKLPVPLTRLLGPRIIRNIP